MEENRGAERLLHASSEQLARAALLLALEKKGVDVRLYRVCEISSITDYYLNLTGRSLTHVASLADEIADALAREGREPRHIEGRRGTPWILLDYGDLIVNIFDRVSREFYHLDRLFPPETAVDTAEAEAEVDSRYSVNTSDISEKE